MIWWGMIVGDGITALKAGSTESLVPFFGGDEGSTETTVGIS